MSALKELDRLSGMEKRSTTLEVIAEQTSLSIDRIYHSVDRLDGTQIAMIIAAIGWMVRASLV